MHDDVADRLPAPHHLRRRGVAQRGEELLETRGPARWAVLAHPDGGDEPPAVLHGQHEAAARCGGVALHDEAAAAAAAVAAGGVPDPGVHPVHAGGCHAELRQPPRQPGTAPGGVVQDVGVHGRALGHLQPPAGAPPLQGDGAGAGAQPDAGQPLDAAAHRVLQGRAGQGQDVVAVVADRGPAVRAQPRQPAGVDADGAAGEEVVLQAGQQLPGGAQAALDDDVRLRALGHPRAGTGDLGQLVALHDGDAAPRRRGRRGGEQPGEARPDHRDVRGALLGHLVPSRRRVVTEGSDARWRAGVGGRDQPRAGRSSSSQTRTCSAMSTPGS
ncbi:hypothetical protein GCM10023225_18760 [Kineococcus glutinatus]|uniref:Uncharacterized protein n=1 Tax=Kineococcus glutinatus TaxID=1070872 RepID=A0ABP9HTY0_9ACTN